jgi:NADH-quinone oxidoreductase subunit N
MIPLASGADGVAQVLAADAISAPSIEYGALAPILIVVAAAILGVLAEACLPRHVRRTVQLVLALGGLVVAFVALLLISGTRIISASGALAIDGPTLFMQGSVLVLSFTAFLLFAERTVDPGRDAFAPASSALPGSNDEQTLTRLGVFQTEVYPLAMFAVVGMLLFPAANDLLMTFVALEILSLPLYLLCAMARRRRLLSQEAAIKYFLLGAFSSAFFLYGAALLYGYSGSLTYGDIAASTAAGTDNEVYLMVGIALVTVGLLFKIGAAPFHQWTPDVYQGAPTPVTAFMAAGTKVAAFGALLRLLFVVGGGIRWDWQPIIATVAIVTMVVGVVLALTQTDIKRLLAYSSIANAGFILAGVVAANAAGTASVMFYLLAYGFATIGAFGVVTLVRDSGGEATHLSSYAGLGKRSPIVAGAMALFLLALAGIPLTSGFIGKFAAFSAAVEGDQALVAIVGVLASAVAAFFYVRVIVLMFFSEPSADGPTVSLPSIYTSASLAIAASVTVVLGVFPGPVLDLADQASVFLR